MSRKILTSLFVCFFALGLWGQNGPKFWLPNGSFEGAPRDALNPEGWESSSYNSTPDILPGPWGVYQRPTDGNTFMGLICREDGTFESVAAKLPKALKKDKCYKFELDLSRSQAYAGYTGVACFRLWGAKTAEEPLQLLASSAPISHYEWKTYQFNFITKAKYSYIIIECYYKTPTLLPYRGNILIDRFLYFEYCERA
ncbi:hypothetical protein [Saprospira grandis]|uniref:Uncharacterized protein n=1 Tax=Saprospira grandis (strain Lewin) TaxID=984262 RepID=H6L126_SAPGL|nr:hypothetical protein [Saprospira grandis]AFC26062.1 hypothetical protein SGRA_3335 [Saprospira grandis str. Lewin]